MFVYLITNTINGMRYVGQTTESLVRRWWFHRKHSNCVYLHAAIKKYGEESFTIESICEPPTIELMNEIEAEYIKRYCTLAPNGYNLTEGGRVPRHSEITREKMRLPHTGLKESEETKRKKSLAAKGKKKSAQSSALRSTITSEQVKEIKRLWATGLYTQTKLATMFPIHQARVSSLVRNKSHNF